MASSPFAFLFFATSLYIPLLLIFQRSWPLHVLILHYCLISAQQGYLFSSRSGSPPTSITSDKIVLVCTYQMQKEPWQYVKYSESYVSCVPGDTVCACYMLCSATALHLHATCNMSGSSLYIFLILFAPCSYMLGLLYLRSWRLGVGYILLKMCTPAEHW